MAFSTLRKTSQIPEVENEEDEQYHLLKCSKVELGIKHREAPMGFYFSPTDDPIVAHFLFNKILDRGLSVTDAIIEIDHLYDYDPNHLDMGDFVHGTNHNEAFYFTYVEQVYSIKGKITKRTTRGGYWEPLGNEVEIRHRHGDLTVGFKISMEFYQGQKPEGRRTCFVMHEYRLNPGVVPTHLLNDNIRTKIQRYVICRIINKEAPITIHSRIKIPRELLRRARATSLVRHSQKQL